MYYVLKLYQMYALRQPKDVYSLLKEYKTNYIILEDSICVTFKPDMCGLVQLLDIDNKHVWVSDFLLLNLFSL